MQPKRIVLLAAVLALVAKLWLASSTIGTTDVFLFTDFGQKIAQTGLAATYANDPLFNHTPLVGYWAAWLYRMGEGDVEQIGLPLRAPGILADFLAVLILLRIRAKTGRPPWWALVIFALSPVSLMISGFHGNVDPVLAVLLLAATWLCYERQPLWCGVALGLACQIKVAPLLVAPVFAALWWERRRFAPFAIAAVLTTLIGWSPALIGSPLLFAKKALGYQGYWGGWGLSYVLRETGLAMFSVSGMRNLPWAEVVVMSTTKYLIIAWTLALAWRGRARDISVTLAGVWAAFFVLATGVAPQYFVWMAPFVLLAAPRWYAVVTGAASVFLFAFYTAICGSVNWVVGISKTQHIPIWGPWAVAAWAVLIVYLSWQGPRSWKGCEPGDGASPANSDDSPRPTMSEFVQLKPVAPVLTPRIFWLLFGLIALVGSAVRMSDSASWRRTGPDEMMYRRYVNLMDSYQGVVWVYPSDKRAEEGKGPVAFNAKIEGTGAMAMPELVDFYLTTQQSPETLCELPPTRFLYIYTSWLWKNAQFGDAPPLSLPEVMRPGKGDDYTKDADHRDPALASLHRVACLFTILLMLAAGLCAWRMFGHGVGLGVLALMAFDPVQLHLSQHAMIDGFFAFWAVMAVWTTWECLRNPSSRGWLAAHTVVLALMVMTKENAFFVYCALALVVASNRWLKFGTVTPRFLMLSFAGGLIGLTALVTLAGGTGNFAEIYKSLVSKAQNLAYAQETGDGPWYRYLLDLLTVSPIVLVLALGAAFVFLPQRKELAFLALFVAGSYLIMCNVPFGMNLRYASIWEFPLRAAAVLMLWQLCRCFGQRQWLAATVLIAGLCAYEFRQYRILAMNPDRPLYELVPNQLQRQISVIKG